MGKGKERPGVMLYFDALRPAISRLDEAQCGALLRSLLDYAQYGALPELDPMTGLAFDMLVPKIDRDAERYEQGREQRQYAVYVREKKKNGEKTLSLADWRLTREPSADNEDIGPISPVIENIGPISPVIENIEPYPSASASTPTTASASTPASTAASTPASTTASAAAAGEGCRGEGEARALYAAWLKAMEAKDNRRALNLSDRLFALGYHADIATRELRKRPTLPGAP